MTLPASFPLSMSQIATELGTSLPLSLLDTRVRGLAQVASGQVSFSNLLGKTGRFDGNITISGGGFGNFNNASIFGGLLAEIISSLSQPQLEISFVSAPPVYIGNLKLTNNSTGASAVLTKAFTTTWTANTVPGNLCPVGTSSYSLTSSP